MFFFVLYVQNKTKMKKSASANKLSLTDVPLADVSRTTQLDDVEIGIGEWNQKLERSIQSLGELSLGYKWMHCEMAKNYAIIYDRLMYVSIGLGPIVGVVNSMNQTLGDTIVVPLLITILAFLTGVLAGIIKFSNYEEKISNHKAAAAKYTSLANNARIQLNLERYDREDAKQYMVWYTTSYGNLFESAPILPDSVMLSWKQHARRHGFRIPGEVGILMDVDDTASSDNVQKELGDLKLELQRKTTQLGAVTTAAKVSTPDSFRLMMCSLGANHSTDFKADDLAKFNKLLMKRKLNEPPSAPQSAPQSQQTTTRSGSESWRDNLPD